MSGGPWEDYAPAKAPVPAAPVQGGPWSDYAPSKAAPAAAPARPGGEFTLSNIVKGIYNSAVSGATLPRDVYQGKVDPMSDEAIGRSMDLAGIASPLSPGKVATQAERSAVFGEAAATRPKPTAPAGLPVAQDAADLGIPLTAGQRTADPVLQSTENAMLGGGKGPQAQRAAQEGLAQQQAAVVSARDAIGETAGRGQADLSRAADAGDVTTQGVRQAAENAKSAYDQKYAAAREVPGMFQPEALKGIRGRIEEGLTARENPVIVDPVLTPAATRALGELDTIGNLKLGVNGQPGAGEEIVGVNMRGVDQARRRLRAFSNAANSNEDKAAVGQIIGEFDGQIQGALENGLFSGSEKALDVWKDARQAFASYQRTFKPQGGGDDVGRALQSIIERDASPEQVANYLYGSAKIGSTGLSVRMADRLKGVLGEGSQEWAAIRQGAWQRLTGVAEGKTEMGAQKMSERILEFVNGDGKSLATRLFSEDELGQMRKLANVQKAIVARPGTTNPSNSGNRLGALAREGMASLAATLGATTSGPLGAGAGYVLGKGIGALKDVRAGAQARQLFSGEAPVSIGQRLAQSGIRARDRGAPKAISRAIPSALPSPGPSGFNSLQGPIGARAQDEQ